MPSYEAHIKAEAALAVALIKQLRKSAPHEHIFVATPHRIQRQAVRIALERELPKVQHVLPTPHRLGLQGHLQLVRRHDRPQELLSTTSTPTHRRRRRTQHNRETHLGLDEAVLGARHEHETLDLEEVRELRRAEFPHGHGVGLFAGAFERASEGGEEGEVGGCERGGQSPIQGLFSCKMNRGGGMRVRG